MGEVKNSILKVGSGLGIGSYSFSGTSRAYPGYHGYFSFVRRVGGKTGFFLGVSGETFKFKGLRPRQGSSFSEKGYEDIEENAVGAGLCLLAYIKGIQAGLTLTSGRIDSSDGIEVAHRSKYLGGKARIGVSLYQSEGAEVDIGFTYSLRSGEEKWKNQLGFDQFSVFAIDMSLSLFES